jgi:hypothetical protein
MDYDSDYETKADATGITDVDPYSGSSFKPLFSFRNSWNSAGIFFSKDRREEVIEVEEEPEVVDIPDVNERVKLMTQGQWMKGCPEGGEQSFLFGLYSQLSEGQCTCPQVCGGSVARKKSDFFAIYVSEFHRYHRLTIDSSGSRISLRTLHSYGISYIRHASAVIPHFVSRAESRSRQLKSSTPLLL